MMNDPATNFLPPASKSSSAACIFTSAFLKRKVTRLLSLVAATMSVLPVPSTPPAATTSPRIGVIGWVRIVLSLIGVMVRSRISGNVHPVSS